MSDLSNKKSFFLQIPQISYASTSTELSDKSRFEYFSRVVPPDNFQAQAMVEIVKELGWKYVSTVAVEGDYGERGIASFVSHSSEANICIAVREKIQRNSKTEDFDRIIERLLQKPARAVVLFVDEDNTRKLLKATIRANRTGYFLWIGSDSWGAKVHPVRDQESAAEGAITILPHRNAIKEFDDYYLSLRPRFESDPCNSTSETNLNHKKNSNIVINCRNPWFREFWSQHNNCSFNNSGLKKCTGHEIITDYEQEGLVPFVGIRFGNCFNALTVDGKTFRRIGRFMFFRVARDQTICMILRIVDDEVKFQEPQRFDYLS
ncbi:hypothetical protein WA026_004429 [Henosepilachna vigintioctopunctata]|uniref:Receptor ligand binding region domain-containing protein n=1 Tax=Henosepilachna vigintioctopunctata TaxID=420089 RepID=A0AAW1V6K5_9CUCU